MATKKAGGSTKNGRDSNPKMLGAMIQTVGLPIMGVEGSVDFQTINVVSVLGAIAVFLASINIFGGFAVTARMLEMFKPKAKKKEG